jgi:hypothetical protein
MHTQGRQEFFFASQAITPRSLHPARRALDLQRRKEPKRVYDRYFQQEADLFLHAGRSFIPLDIQKVFSLPQSQRQRRIMSKRLTASAYKFAPPVRKAAPLSAPILFCEI